MSKALQLLGAVHVRGHVLKLREQVGVRRVVAERRGHVGFIVPNSRKLDLVTLANPGSAPSGHSRQRVNAYPPT